MKPLVIVSLIALSGSAIGLFQHSLLADLNKESARLAGEIPPSFQRLPARRGKSADRNVPPAATVLPAVSLDELEGLILQMAAAMSDKAALATMEDPRQRLAPAFAGLDAQTVFKLIERLKAHDDFPAKMREDAVARCVGFLMQADPGEALHLLELLPDFPDRETALARVFNRWSTENPKAALAWFEEESAKGNPITRSAGMLSQAMLTDARENPSRTLARALSKEVAEVPDSLANLGGSIAASLDGEDENRVFFDALRRESEKSPGSAVLAEIRGKFVAELIHRFDEWPVESAIALIEVEFTPTEKAAMVTRLKSLGNLDQPGSWATWMWKVDLPADEEHPLNDFMTVWSFSDPAEVEKWLGQAPAGDLKDQLVGKYAGRIPDPASGIRLALGMREGSQRAKVLGEIGENWKREDPEAAAAFFLKNGDPSKP